MVPRILCILGAPGSGKTVLSSGLSAFGENRKLRVVDFDQEYLAGQVGPARFRSCLRDALDEAKRSLASGRATLLFLAATEQRVRKEAGSERCEAILFLRISVQTVVLRRRLLRRLARLSVRQRARRQLPMPLSSFLESAMELNSRLRRCPWIGGSPHHLDLSNAGPDDGARSVATWVIRHLPEDCTAAYYEHVFLRAASRESAGRRMARVHAGLVDMHTALRDRFRGRRVLEAGCGSGRWTAMLASIAERVDAFDVSCSAVSRARSLNSALPNARFHVAGLPGPAVGANGGFAAFVWSHLSSSQRQGLLYRFASRMPSGSPIVLVDDHTRPSSVPCHVDASGERYELREVAGQSYWVLKNLPSGRDQLEIELARIGAEVTFRWLRHRWVAMIVT